MSNFYRNYKRNEQRKEVVNKWLAAHPKKKEQDVPEELLKEDITQYPRHLVHEILTKEAIKQNIRQANMTTRGKHTGSKNKSRILYNVHRGTRMIQGIMSGYNE